jgi:hypothetical protein
MIEPALLMHFDGLAGSTTFTDSSLNALVATGQNGATIETSIVKFGSGALSLNGATDYVSVPITSAGPLDLSTTDFTVEFWAYSENENDNLFLDVSLGATKGFWLEQTLGANIQLSLWTGGSYTTLQGTLLQNTWTAVALVRYGSTFTLYVNGVSAGTLTYAGSLGPMAGNTFNIGGGFRTSLLGAIDELRVSDYAVYTANYTPQTAPFPNPIVPQSTLNGDITDPLAWQDASGNLPPAGYANNSDGSNF